MENESNKHYLCLNRPDYTCYPNEKEVLLQAGLKAKVISFAYEEHNNETIAVFELHITEKRQWYEKIKMNLMFIVPFLTFFVLVTFGTIYGKFYSKTD